MWMTAFILPQLLPLHFAIIYSLQLSSSERSSMYLKDFKNLDFFFFFFFSYFSFVLLFSLTNAYLLWQLRKEYPVLWAANRFVGSETLKHNDFEQFWKFKFHFEHFPRNTRFPTLKDPVITCIYLRTTDRHFRHQGNVHHPASKLLKYNLVQILNTFRNPFLRIFAGGKASLAWFGLGWYLVLQY